VNVRARRFPLLDSMRAIAFGCVFVSHTAFFAGFGAEGSTLRPFLARLDVGVRIFFLISAFLLYRPFVAARLRGEAPPLLRGFAWRRFLRVAPPYWLALCVIGLWLGAPGVFTPEHAPLYFGFAHVYNTDTLTVNAMPQAWSVCVEVAFYTFLAIYATFMRRVGGGLRAELVAAAGLFGVSLAYKLWVFSMGPVTDLSLLPWRLALPEYLDYFAVGIALAALSVVWEDTGSLPRAIRLVDRWPWLPWLAAAALFVVVSKGIGLTGSAFDQVTEARYLGRHYLYAVIALGLLLPALFGEPTRGLVRRLLGWRPLLWVGLVSYGAYLFHFAVLQQLGDWDFGSFADDTTPYVWFPVALAGALAIAAVSWYAFERPVLSLKRLVPARPVEEGEATLEPAPAAPEGVAGASDRPGS
jgi:peptidoglycan/LPS O-acetylase OafA/YrhL